MALKQTLNSPAAAKLYVALLAVAASYLGYEKVQEYQTSDVKVDVVVEAPKNTAHSHEPVLGRDAISAMIKQAIEDQNAKNSRIYKKLESWESNN
jgi:hypothetical protein